MATISHQSFVFSSKNNWGREVHTWAWQADKHTEKRGWEVATPIIGKQKFWGKSLTGKHTRERARMFWLVFFSCKTQRLKFVVVELGKFFCRITIWRKIWFVILLFFLAFFLGSRLFYVYSRKLKKNAKLMVFYSSSCSSLGSSSSSMSSRSEIKIHVLEFWNLNKFRQY